MATRNTGWGYTRLRGALRNVGYAVGRNTIKRILKEQGIEPAPVRRRQYSWATFIKAHLSAITAADFFTVEVLTWRGLATYYVLFFLQLETRRVSLAGITRHPTEEWMTQMGRNATDEACGCLRQHRYVLHDRDTKFGAEDAGRRRGKVPATSGA